MKGLIFLLCFPLMAFAQTIHTKGKKIFYEGMITLPASSTAEMQSLSRPFLEAAVEKGTVQSTSLIGQNTMVAKCTLPLNTPFHLIRKLHFDLQLAPTDNGYTYRIDSVYITENRRGGKRKDITDEKLLEDRDQYGPAAVENERLLNEIDMRFQKLLSLLKRHLAKNEIRITKP